MRYDSIAFVADSWSGSFSIHGWTSQVSWWHTRVSQGLYVLYVNAFKNFWNLHLPWIHFLVLFKQNGSKSYGVVESVAFCSFSFLCIIMVRILTSNWQFYKNLSTGLKDIIWKTGEEIKEEEESNWFVLRCLFRLCLSFVSNLKFDFLLHDFFDPFREYRN